MEAKTWQETVIPIESLASTILAYPALPMGQAISRKQAEISFKAGQDESIEKIRDAFNRGYEKGKEEAELAFQQRVKVLRKELLRVEKKLDDVELAIEEAKQEGIQIGRKEVVEWLKKHKNKVDPVRAEMEHWDNLLKEWEIEDESLEQKG